MKISIITVVFNGEAYLEKCFQSVAAQCYPDIEHIVIDGGSSDRTLEIIQAYRNRIHQIVSEPDRGLYDAINKGIILAKGDVIGILNADDEFASSNILTKIVETFSKQPYIDGLYGNLNYIHPKTGKILRNWKSKPAGVNEIKAGWMPAHPTVYLKKEVFEQYGCYALDLGTTADYDLMLRLFFTHQIKTIYLPELMVKMRIGGVSNRSIRNIWQALINDYKAIKRNQLPNPLKVLILKKLSKLNQF